MASLIPVEVCVDLNDCQTSHKILFMIASIEGNCDLLADLAESLTKQSIKVYGLQFNYSLPLDSINKIALCYVDLIKTKLQNHNTEEFYLLGYSFGGLIGIEIARVLNNTNPNQIQLKKLFLFESSKDFFKVGAHSNFHIFNVEIVSGNIFDHKHVFTAVLSLYLCSIIGLNDRKLKYNLYSYIKTSENLEDAIDNSFVYLDKTGAYAGTNSEKANLKEFLKLLLLKSAIGYDYVGFDGDTVKLSVPTRLFRSKNFMYKHIESAYKSLKNSIDFNFNDYSLSQYCLNLKIFVFDEGNHWTFINENLSEIQSILRNEIYDEAVVDSKL